MYNITLIPEKFCPYTVTHEEIIDFYCEPAIQKLFKFLARIKKPGEIIEFHKEDFDNHCKRTRRRGAYSVGWFVYALKKLIETRLVKVLYNYGHYVYKIQLFHPWQVDDWVIKDDRWEWEPQNGNHSQKISEKTKKDSGKTAKKEASNPDSFVPLDREERLINKDKQSRKDDERVTDSQYYKSSTGYTSTNVVQKNNISNKDNFATQNKEPLPKPKLKRHSLSHLLKLKPLKQGLNVDLKQQQEELIDEEKVTRACNTEVTESLQASDATVAQDISPVDNTSDTTPEVKNEVQKTDKDKPSTRIVNKDWRKHLEELDDLGVLENSTVRKAVQSNSMTTVKNAIALYREKKRHSHIHNPCGYFIQALKEKWGSKQSAPPINDSDSPEDKLTIFRLWYDLGKELGHCTKYEQRDGEFWVLKSGYWERFTDLWNQGYTLDYFRKEFKKYTKP